MLIIPAIDIRAGKCVRLLQGDYNRETVYAEDPLAMAAQWTDQGAKFLHLVDLDGAREGTPRNQEVILAIAERASIPVQVGGGIRNQCTVNQYLSGGVCRVIMGTIAYSNPSLFKEICAKWPGRIAIDIAAKRGKVAVDGWTKETEVLAVDLARKGKELGASLIVYTDILRDGTHQGINFQATRNMARALKIPLIASGGVSTIKDIEALRPLEADGVIGVIVGRALYAGTLDLPEAIALANKKGF
jgi:phosphoribosylformimino-5-aminoimidazole carboxamide ribotide isomerase